MHSHDLDLIAAFADGSLQETGEAQSLIDSCADCRAEFEAQRSALAAVAALPPVGLLTDIEKAALHRDLWTELRNPPVAARASNPWWYRWSYAAAGLFVVVGLFGVLNQLGGQEDSGQPEALVAADTTAAADGESGYEEEPFVSQGEDSGAGATVPDPEESPTESASPPTTAAAATETTIATATDADFEEVAANARSADLPESTTPTTVPVQADQCLDDEALGGQEVLATIELDRTYLILVPAGVQLTQDTPITFVDAATCEVVRVVE